MFFLFFSELKFHAINNCIQYSILISFQLVKICPVAWTKQYVELSFLEHHSCECRYGNQTASKSAQELFLKAVNFFIDFILFITILKHNYLLLRPKQNHKRCQR